LKILTLHQIRRRALEKGERIEARFTGDLQILLSRKKIKNYWKSEWHGELDKSGVDALVTRRDGIEIKINVTTTNRKTVKRHRNINKKLGRAGILIWSHDENLDRELRLRNLLRAINEFNPQS
jgi:hypothetical protein